jgi:hypothetical protein
MGKTVLKLVVALALAVFAGRAVAQDSYDFGLDEVRGGLFWHSVDHAPPGSFLGFIDTTRFQDLNVELLFTPFDLGDWNWLGEIRPHVGGTFNFGGLESQVYGGLSWTHHIAGGPVFIEASFGGAVHNGALAGAVAPARNLGCQALFRESGSLGYQITEQASIMLTVEHSSHAGLCGSNNVGITNLGFRAGWKF